MDENDGHDGQREVNILVGATGSVAAIKIPILIRKLLAIELKSGVGHLNANLRINVKLVVTENSLHFFNRHDLVNDGHVCLLTDAHEWDAWKHIQDPVMHIELRRWAHIMVIAPLDANTMAKIACGMCDNLLTSIVRAWDPLKRLVFCPAMNTFMWDHPITAQNVTTLKSYGYIEVPVIEKKLACGDTGLGAMAEVDDIVAVVSRELALYLNRS